MEEKSTVAISLRDLLIQCSVRVLDPRDSKHAGTGFFVAPGFVATCAHVVKAVGDSVEIVLHNGKSLTATVSYRIVDVNDYPDLALLTVIDSEQSARDYAILDADVQEGDTLVCWGFPENYPNGEGLTLKYEGSFNVSGYSELLKLKQGLVQPGYSGAPLLNIRTGAVCGLIKSTRDWEHDVGGRAVSVSLLMKMLSEQLERAQSASSVACTRWGLLRSLPRVSDGGQGSISITISSFIEKWTQWSTDPLLEIGAGDDLGGDLVPSSIESEWKDFVHTLPWRKRIRNDVDRYSQYVAKLVVKFGISDFPMLTLDTEGRYSDVRERLANWLRATKPKWMALESAINNSNSLHRGADEPFRTYIVSARRAWSRLVRMADRDQARLCLAFLIYGPLGCGKSQFIRSRRTELGDSGEWYAKGWQIALFLPISSRSLGISVEQAILDRAREASNGFVWRSIGDLDRLLSALRIKLIITVDDLEQAVQRSGVCSSICAFIDNHTHLDSLSYLFSIQDTQVDLITQKEALWTLFSHQNTERQPHPPDRSIRVSRMAGWLDLSYFNRECQLGYRILAEAGFHEAIEVLKASQTLPSPLEAKIMIFMIRRNNDIRVLASLNFINFLNEFWNELIARAEVGLHLDEILRGLSCVAEAIFHSSDLAPALEKVKESLFRAKLDSESVIALLKQTSVLAVDIPKSPFKLFDQAFSVVHLNYQYLWNKALAEELWKNLDLAHGQRDPEVVAWLERITSDPQVREGIWEFVLLLADAAMEMGVAGQVDRKRTYQIWAYAFEQPRLPIRAPCLAARWASERTQKKLAALLHKKAEVVVERGSLFALLFFAMETPALSPPERFKLIRPYYRNLSESGIAPYFLNGADRTLFGLEYSGHLESCLSALANSHLTGLAQELASSAWDTFVELHGEDVEHNLRTLMSGFLLYDGTNAIGEYHNWNREQGRRPKFFREKMIGCALDWSWRTKHYAMRVRQFFDLLHSIGWYDGTNHGVNLHIAAEMRSEANLSFGRHFRALERQGDQEEKEVESYKDLIKYLLSGEIRDIQRSEELGYFMLRHTDYVAGQTAHISPMLWEEVDIAYKMPELKRFFESHPITKEQRTPE